MTDAQLQQMNCSAFFAVSEVARILRLAIERRQTFSVHVNAAESPDGARLDGSYEVRIKVEPTKPTFHAG
jgi:hypothetical protein